MNQAWARKSHSLGGHMMRKLGQAVFVAGLLGSLMGYADNHSAVNGKDPNTVEWPTGVPNLQVGG